MKRIFLSVFLWIFLGATTFAQTFTVDKSITIARVSETAKFVMQDGTIVFGRLEPRSFDLQTAYGQLSIPVGDIVRIRFACKANPEVRKQAARLIKLLGDADFNTRDTAMVELTKLGVKAYADLEQAVVSEDPEVRARASKIMESLRLDVDNLLTMEEDEVTTRTDTFRGTLKTDVLTIVTKFGSLRVGKSDVLTMTAAIEEYTKQCRLTESYVTAKAFYDTKIQVRRGDRLDFTAVGQLAYPSTQQTFTAEGKVEAGQWQNLPFGAVVAKIGPNGTVFKVGEATSLRAEQDGVLYLAIVHNQVDPNARGWFKVNVSHQPAPVPEAPK